MYAHTLGTIAAAALTAYLLQTQQKLWFQRNFRNGKKLHLLFVATTVIIGILQFMQLIGRSQQLVDDLINTVIYSGLVFLIFLTVRQKIHRPSAHSSLKILAIGAHPDDLEIACGGTLAKLADAGHIIHAIVMCDGKVGGDAEIRPDEAKNGARFMGISEIEIHNFTDTKLANHEVELVQVIERKIIDFVPDVIFTHSKNDQHQDHQAVHFATLRAARRHPSVLCYESPSSTREFDPSFFVDLSEYVNVKVHAVEQHKDQLKKPYMGSEHVRSIAAFRGSQAKMRFAEGFEIVRLVDSSLEGI